MDMTRKQLLECKLGARLTPEEIKEGYHFCNEWDGMVVGPEDPEWEDCKCTFKEAWEGF